MKKRSIFTLYTGILMLVNSLHVAYGHNEAPFAEFWSGPATQWVYAPGIFCSEYMVCKHCSLYKASTGEYIRGKHALELVNGATTRSCNFAEIVLTPATESHEKKPIVKTKFYDFAQKILNYRFKAYEISIEGPSDTGLSLKPYFINFYRFNIGQNLDVDILSKNYDACCTLNNFPIVPYGTSRGAATVFNFIATQYQNKSEKRVKALILEGCFDAVRNIGLFNSLLTVLPHYKRHGIAPIDLVKEFVMVCNAHSIPVLIVTSEIDEIVPYKNTMNLCEALAREGLKDLYVLVLKNSGHRDYTCSNGEDMQRYQRVAHAFYKKCGCSHNTLLAEAGLADLELCAFNTNNIKK